MSKNKGGFGIIEIRKYRIYPTKEQERTLAEQLETCRRLWNRCLAERKGAWENERISVSWFEQKRQIAVDKRSSAFLQGVYSHVLQDVVLRLERAYQAFFKKNARYPKFKKFGSYDSITYPDAYNGSIRLGVTRKNTKIYLSKIGYVPILAHRDPSDGKNKRCTVKREGIEWYVVLEYEVPDVAPRGLPIEHPVGIDLGLKALITTSDGWHVKPPKPLKVHERRLKHLQRELSRKQKGSKNRVKAIERMAKQSRKVARTRRDFNHKLSRQIADKYDFVAMEKLQIRDMADNHCLAKSIHDAGWGQLCGFVDYKVQRKGNRFVQPSAWRSTMECNVCKHVKDMPLCLRVYSCPACGNTIDRDENAARNILERGLSQVGEDIAELMPVESGVQPGRTNDLASPFCEAGTVPGGG
ncbi:MAG: transposase [Thermoplasmata archaeon]